MNDNQRLRELFSLPPFSTSTSTAIDIPKMPPQRVVTGDPEVDAVLWLQEVVKTGNQVLINKAMVAAKRIETPMEELGRRYAAHIARTTGNSLGAVFASSGFGQLESQAKRAIERARHRHEAHSRFGSLSALVADTPAEKACKRALRGLKRDNFNFYDEQQACNRFENYPELVPATIYDCLHARAFWRTLYSLRAASNDGFGDASAQSYAHETFCRSSLGRIRPRTSAEAVAALDHIDEDGGPDWADALPIIRHLVISAWNRGAAPPSGSGAQINEKWAEALMDAGIEVVPTTIRNAIENLAGGAHRELVQQLLGLLQPHFTKNADSRYGAESTSCNTILQSRHQIIPKIIPGRGSWVWTGDELPPMGVPVFCLDDANKPQDACTATRENDWEGVQCWWMHIPAVDNGSPPSFEQVQHDAAPGEAL